MSFIYVPLENLPQRYSQMINDSIYPHADKIIYPEFNYSDVIEKGQFLDINKTIIFKTKQLQMIAEMFLNGEVKNNDKFLFADIFFPGIESLRYMADLQNIKIEIYGFNYAGRADQTDFVRTLGTWADSSEKGYHEICDKIFVGSNDHRKNVMNYFHILNESVVTTGYIWDTEHALDTYYNPSEIKQDYVIWPHRICPEKGLGDLLLYAELTDKQIVITSSGNKVNINLPKNIEYIYGLTKKEYYEIMSKAKWYLSTAYQETFGYTIQEAILYRCNILVPNRACMPEMVLLKNLYNNVLDIDDKLNNEDLVVPLGYTIKWSKNVNKVLAEMGISKNV